MADTTAHTETHVVPEVDAAAPAVHHAEEHAVEATPITEEAAAAEPEATFSTQVEPSDAPVLNADDTPVEPAAEEHAATDVAAAEGEAHSPTASSGSDKKSKSWIAKLTSNIKKLADKKPKTEKATSAAEAENPATVSEEHTAAETEGDAHSHATAPIEAVASENAPVAAVDETPAETHVEAEAEAPAAATTEHAGEEKSASGEAAAAEPPKLGKRLSFNFFKKSNKADKEKEKAAANTPAPVAEAPETTEAAEATPATKEEEEEEVAPPTPAKDHAPVIEATHIPSELAVEETAVAAAH